MNVREALSIADFNHTKELEYLNEDIDKISAQLIRLKNDRKQIRLDRSEVLEALHQLDLAEGKS